MSEQSDYRVVGSGISTHVGEARADHAAQRLDELLARAERSGEHLWTAVLAFTVDPTDDEPVFDAENLVGPVMVGCYRCEEPYVPRLLHRRCKGDPDHG